MEEKVRELDCLLFNVLDGGDGRGQLRNQEYGITCVCYCQFWPALEEHKHKHAILAAETFSTVVILYLFLMKFTSCF